MKKYLVLLSFVCSINAFAITEQFINIDCNKTKESQLCAQYEKDAYIFKQRKENFKKNRIKYFFYPESLIDGLKTPTVFNLLLDDVFKNIHKENISQAALSYSKKMAVLIDDYYKRYVITEIQKIDDEKNIEFKNEIVFNDKVFKRKMEVLKYLIADKDKMDDYQQAYLNSSKGKSLSTCLVQEYLLLKNKTWKSPVCKIPE